MTRPTRINLAASDRPTNEESSRTLAGPSQNTPEETEIQGTPIISSHQPGDDNEAGSSDLDSTLDAEIRAAQATQRALEEENARLEQKRSTVAAINRRIAELEQVRAGMRNELRLSTASAAPADHRSAYSPRTSRDMEESSIDGVLGEDMILQEPSPGVLKTFLDRERSLRVRQPEVYRGKSITEWKSFIEEWEAVFRTQPWTYNSHSARVNTAATLLRDTPRVLWEAYLKSKPDQIIHWEEFKEMLSDSIQARSRKFQDAFEALRTLSQEKGETVAQLYARMIEIEQDLGIVPEVTRVRTLDAALQDHGVRKQLASMLQGEQAENVNHWIEKAQQAEHVVRAYSRTRPSQDPSKAGSSQDKSNSADQSQGWKGKKRKKSFKKDHLSKKGSVPASTSSAAATKDVVCFTCKNKGHYSSDRSCPKYEEWVRMNPEKAKKLEDFRSLRKEVNEIRKEDRQNNSQKASSKPSGNDRARS